MNNAQWTLMIYMAGDNTLSPAGEVDVDEMRMVGSTDQVNVVVLYDGFGTAGAARGRIQKEGEGENIEALKEINTGDPKTLIEFAEWAATHYPAERFGLILWSHGNGWQPYDIKQIAQKVHSSHFDNQERSVAGLNRALFRPTLEEILNLPTKSERAICMDDSSAQSLDTVALGKALEGVSRQLNQKLEFLGMDACLMSTLEVAYQVQPYAHYFVASEDLVPEGGWDYRAVLTALITQPHMAGDQLGKHVLNSYRRMRTGGSIRLNIAQTLGVFDLTHTSHVAEAIDDFAKALTPLLTQQSRQIFEALADVKQFLDGTLWDASGLCRQIAGKLNTTELKQTAMAVSEALREGNGFVIRQKVLGGSEADYCGLAIYLPAMIDISTYYAKITFAQHHQWFSLLNKLIPQLRRFR